MLKNLKQIRFENLSETNGRNGEHRNQVYTKVKFSGNPTHYTGPAAAVISMPVGVSRVGGAAQGCAAVTKFRLVVHGSSESYRS